MVLDSKVMEWASRQGLDTAALKKAKVPIFGKWYFPDLPANTPLVNLSTGETETFPAGYRAGAVLYVKDEDLRTAGLGRYKAVAAPAPPPAPEPVPAAAPALEPVAAPAATAVAAAPAAAAVVTAPAPTPGRPDPAPRPALAAALASSTNVQQATDLAHHTPAHGASHGASHGAAAAHSSDHAHPGPKQYVMIALILSVITAIEVWVYYIPALLPYIFPILLVLSLVKFVMVVGWFMHLRFDHSSFTWYFVGGLGLAIATFSGLLLLQIATHGTPPGDGNAQVFPANLAPAVPVAKPAGGH